MDTTRKVAGALAVAGVAVGVMGAVAPAQAGQFTYGQICETTAATVAVEATSANGWPTMYVHPGKCTPLNEVYSRYYTGSNYRTHYCFSGGSCSYVYGPAWTYTVGQQIIVNQTTHL